MGMAMGADIIAAGTAATIGVGAGDIGAGVAVTTAGAAVTGVGITAAAGTGATGAAVTGKLSPGFFGSPEGRERALCLPRMKKITSPET